MLIRIRRGAMAENREGIALPGPVAAASASAIPASTSVNEQDGRQLLPAPPFMSLREAADWLCVSLSTLKRLIAKGELSTVRVGARQKIPANQLSAYIAKDVLLPSQAAMSSQT